MSKPVCSPPYLYPEMQTRVEIGKDIYVENSIPSCKTQKCPYCWRKRTPKFIHHLGAQGKWICGSEECINFYIFTEVL